jgi:hypothetical protein
MFEELTSAGLGHVSPEARSDKPVEHAATGTRPCLGLAVEALDSATNERSEVKSSRPVADQSVYRVLPRLCANALNQPDMPKDLADRRAGPSVGNFVVGHGRQCSGLGWALGEPKNQDLWRCGAPRQGIPSGTPVALGAPSNVKFETRLRIATHAGDASMLW